MTGCYLTTLPRAFMRGIADFDPEWASSYFLPRDAVKPPLSLLRRVWPDLDRWQAAHLERPDATEQVEPNLAAGGFIELLQRLRSVFLQVPKCIAQFCNISPFASSSSLILECLGFSSLADRISKPPDI
jgi:hypothetical protein